MSGAGFLVVCLGLGLGAPLTVVGARLFEMASWQRKLVAYQLVPPGSLSQDNVVAWLSTVAAATHPSRFSLLPVAPVVFEVVSDARGVRYFILVVESDRASLLSGVQAAMPGSRLTEAPEYAQNGTRFAVAAELTMTSHVRPLASDRAEQVSTALLASLQPVPDGSSVRVQWIFTSAGTPQPVRVAPGSETGHASSWLWEDTPPADAEAVRAARLKHRGAQLIAVARIGIEANESAQAYALLRRTWHHWHGLNAIGVRLRRRLLPSRMVARRVAERSIPVTRWPLTLSVAEAAGLLALPLNGVRLPGVQAGAARQLPPLASTPKHGAIIGRSNYPGLTETPLRISTTDRLHHLHLVGPTGTGKSTLIAQLALQDIAAGHATIVVDPKGDLIDSIAERIPSNRHDDVVRIDPGNVSGHIIGFNPLQVPRGGNAELVADRVLTILHSIYREFWGPRTDDLLRAALFSLTHTRASDGSAFTLVEVPEMFTNPALRQHVMRQPSLPCHLQTYWQQFEAQSTEARLNAIAPVLNKLRAFTMRTPIRLMLGQSDGVRLDSQFRRQSILLVSLAKGSLGSESGHLLGSLFVGALWQATLSRTQLAPERRAPVFAYLDEFQDITRFGTSSDLADMLAQARGLGLGLGLAHQYLNQLPASMQQAVLGTVRSTVAFQTDHDDAVALARRLAPLTADDLQGLAAYEIVARLSTNGATGLPVTGVTLPLGKSTGDAHELATASQRRHGQTREAIETGIQARLNLPGPERPGRRTRHGGAS